MEQWKGQKTLSVIEVKRKKSYKRGYPVALLVGFEDDRAVLWQVFSHAVKLHLALKLEGKRTDAKALYNFHESAVDALRPMLKEGIRSIIVAAPIKTTYASDFLDHVRKHHSYLMQSKSPNKAAFAELMGSANQPHRVAELVKTKEFRELISDTTSGEADHTIDMLEECLSTADSNCIVMFSLKEIEDIVYDRERNNNFRTEYLMLTAKYLADSKDKSRVQRLLQISKNKKVKTRIVNTETPAGKRINQFGGIVFFTTPNR